MSSYRSRSPADRLVMACLHSDLASAQEAVMDGARVNEEGVGMLNERFTPLRAAVFVGQRNIVKWLLSQGADPNGSGVMHDGVWIEQPPTLQLLIDAGGDVNNTSGLWRPLFQVLESGQADELALLLAQPSLDFTVVDHGKTPQEYARYKGARAVADMIRDEVSGSRVLYKRPRLGSMLACSTAARCVVIGRSHDGRHGYVDPPVRLSHSL